MSDKSSASTLRRDYENNITYHGSRFGTGIKQLEPVNDARHRIMDYSIHDAIEAGFNHVVFIIRKDIEKEFKEVIGDRIASICSAHNVTVDYAFQDINDIPGELPAGRTKPCLCVGRLLMLPSALLVAIVTSPMFLPTKVTSPERLFMMVRREVPA